MVALRERYRDWYATKRDPIADERFLWRAQSFRHLVHLLPGQSILLSWAAEAWHSRGSWCGSRAQKILSLQ